jgi:DNA-binding transcriptional regulator YhcF (GntR family)
MKWFKHDTDARHDPKVRALKRKFGIEGYGIYFQLVEIIGENIEKDNYKEWGYVQNIYTVESLAEECGVSPDKLRSVLAYCDEIGLFEQKNGKLYCKNVKKRLDEYSQKIRPYKRKKVSGVSRDKVPHRIDKDKDKDKDKDNTASDFSKSSELTAKLRQQAHALIGREI